MRFYCTVCGYLHEGDSVPNQCPVCQTDAFKEETLYILRELRCSDQLIQEMQKLRDSDIIEYELKMSQFRAQYDNKIAMKIEERRKQAAQQSNTTTCPRCGNTTFTPMKKKWSMLTGFATNQVELVCNNCGYRMKAK